MLRFARNDAWLALSATLLIIASPRLLAHEGHDHGPPPVVAPLSTEAGSLSWQTERLEIVARQVGDDVVVTIDDNSSNAPVEAALVSVQSEGKTALMRPIGPGTFAAKAALLGAAGAHDVTIAAAVDGREERVAGALATAAGGSVPVPHRHADGAVFLAKPAQHLLDIRTASPKAAELAPSRELTGRVVPDPNAFGRVQAVRDGRIEAPGEGFPHLGQSVTEGEVLAVLVPTLSSFEEASLREKLAQIERDMAALVPRADAVGQVNPNMPMSDAAAGVLQELQIQSQGLRRQHELIAAALAQRIELKAPLAGVIARADVAAGQVVAARDVLFEVVNRSEAMVEAFSFEPAREEIAGASGVTEDGRALKLVFLGRGRVLRQQAVPLLFRVTEGAAALDIGTPVRVLVTAAQRQRGIKLPRGAVQRGFGNLSVVWEHTAPETFVPHIVTLAPLDADNVLVTGGLDDGLRVVTTGAQFVSQVR